MHVHAVNMSVVCVCVYVCHARALRLSRGEQVRCRCCAGRDERERPRACLWREPRICVACCARVMCRHAAGTPCAVRTRARELARGMCDVTRCGGLGVGVYTARVLSYVLEEYTCPASIAVMV